MREFSVIFLLVTCYILIVTCQETPLRFATYLDTENKYELRWDFNETHMEFQTIVQTTGYIGFGISKLGLMTPADIVIGWITKDELYFGDYHTEPGSRAPKKDMSLDWNILGGTEADGYTVLRFVRKLDTCDPDDEPITPDTMIVIYSYHDNDPNVTSGLVHYHGEHRRGSKYVQLMEKNMEPILNPNTTLYSIDFANYQFPIPQNNSFRICIVYNMTGYLERSHVIKYEPKVTPGNEWAVYRMMLYRCDLSEPVEDGRRYECENEAPVPIKSCKNIVANWAMGGEAVNFPNGLGLPIGGDEEPSIYVLEIHYSNFQRVKDLNDSSGIRLVYTPDLRTYDAGLLELGTVITNGWKKVIPQGEPNYVTQAYCSPRCMDWGFANDSTPLIIVGILFQGNDIATSMKLRHFRGPIELPWISRDSAFSNFYQNMRFLKNPIEILRWDNLVLECVYNASTRQGITVGGWSRIEETCRATVIYYPRKSFDMCLGWSSLDKLKNETGHLVPEGEAVDYLSKNPTWDTGTKMRVRHAIRDSSERSICAAVNRSPAYAIDRYEKPRGETPYTPAPSVCNKINLIPPINTGNL